MSEEILSRLERIDHKEYSGGFEFADSSTFDEMARCFEERKILAKEIERLNNIISNMEEELLLLYLDFVEFNVDKAKEEIRRLKGVDKEWMIGAKI